MSQQETGQSIDPLRQFGKGDLRGLMAGTPEETTANVYAHLLAEYQAMGLNLTQEQIMAHVTDTVELAESEAEAVFSGPPGENPEDREQRITKLFLSVAYTDSMLMPGALRIASRRPAAIFDGRTFVDFLTEGRVDEIIYSRYKFHGAENNP